MTETLEAVVERLGQQYIDDADAEGAFDRVLRAAYLAGQQQEREEIANEIAAKSKDYANRVPPQYRGPSVILCVAKELERLAAAIRERKPSHD